MSTVISEKKDSKDNKNGKDSKDINDTPQQIVKFSSSTQSKVFTFKNWVDMINMRNALEEDLKLRQDIISRLPTELIGSLSISVSKPEGASELTICSYSVTGPGSEKLNEIKWKQINKVIDDKIRNYFHAQLEERYGKDGLTFFINIQSELGKLLDIDNDNDDTANEATDVDVDAVKLY